MNREDCKDYSRELHRLKKVLEYMAEETEVGVVDTVSTSMKAKR